jgi:hypothetical protein
MGLLKTLKGIFVPPRPARRFHTFQVRCGHCGEVLEGRLDLYNDPSLAGEGEQGPYLCRKVLVGSGRCHQPVEVIFRLDERRAVLEQQITGGVFTEPAA